MYARQASQTPAQQPLPCRSPHPLSGEMARGLNLGAWLGIFVLLFVGAGLIAYLPCASFAELGIFVLFSIELRGRNGRWQRTPLDPLVGAILAVDSLAAVLGYVEGFGARSPYAAGACGGGVFGPVQLFLDQLAAFAAYYLAAWRVAAWRATGWRFAGSETSAGDSQPSPAGQDPIAASLLLSAGVVAALCLVQWAMSFVHKPDDPRIQASFINPNLLGSYLALLAPAASGAALCRAFGRPARRWLWLLTLGLVWSLWLSQSRGAWIGLGLGTAFMAAALWKSAAGDPQARQKRGRAAMRILAGAALAAILFGAFVAPRIEQRWHGHSKEERWIIWDASLTIIRAHPLLGVGENGFPAAMRDLRLKQLNDFTPSGYPLVPSIHLHAHNLLLQYGVEKGIAGILVCLWLIASLFWALGRMLTGDGERSALLPVAAGVGAGLIALLTQCAADYTLWYAPVLILAWILFGAFFALSETGTLTDEANFDWRNNSY